MPEPTIKELIDYLGNVEVVWGGSTEIAAIRAILEQHRDNQGDIVVNTGSKEFPHYERVVPKSALPPHWELDPIRAFVERVEKQWGTGRYIGMRIALEEMEKETDAESND